MATTDGNRRFTDRVKITFTGSRLSGSRRRCTNRTHSHLGTRLQRKNTMVKGQQHNGTTDTPIKHDCDLRAELQ